MFNHFAFTFIAIYGYSFADAGRATWQLLRQVGMMPLMNHYMIQGVCILGCIVGGALAALVAVIMISASNLDGVVEPWSGAMLGFVIGFIMVIPPMEVVESTVTAIFICYAKNGRLLQVKNPPLYEVAPTHILPPRAPSN